VAQCRATTRTAADRLCLIDVLAPHPGQSPRTSNRGDAMKYINGTARILIIYLICMIAGQAIAVGIGLLLDPYSKTLALSVFIPLYYAMYWVAWRVALWIGDRPSETATDATGGSSGAKAASWPLAPAVLALDLAD
jgi:MFS-type transporter involved in bile tolerance (Atg22 family)